MVPDSLLVEQVKESPNWRARGPEDQVSLVVLHGTWMADDDAALARLCDAEAEVSCHYYIGRGGQVVQLVGEGKVAWHAGASSWGGRDAVNGFSLGIEIGNRGPFAETPNVDMEQGDDVDWSRAEPYREAQYEALIKLLWDIVGRYPGLQIVGHDDVAPGRKVDPGMHFDWQRLTAEGLPVGRGVRAF